MNVKHAFLFLSMVLSSFVFWNGCATSRVIENTRVPEIVIDEHGTITFNNKRVEIKKLAAAVKSAGITRKQEVNILVPDKFDNALRKSIYAKMVHGGYTRTIFVTSRKATATVHEKK